MRTNFRSTSRGEKSQKLRLRLHHSTPLPSLTINNPNLCSFAKRVKFVSSEDVSISKNARRKQGKVRSGLKKLVLKKLGLKKLGFGERGYYL